MKFQALNDKISELTVASKKLSSPADQVNALSAAGEVANEIIKILNSNVTGLRHGEDALEDIISSNNFKNYKVEGWFSFHPIYPDERLALRFYESDLCEVKFYWLNDNSTKARISAGVMLTPNWEDRETTENDDYRVGIDFFLKKDASALLMVISQRGNLRVMEFSERLTHTQVEILEKIAGSLTLTSKRAFHEVLWNALALSEVNKKFYEGVAKQFTILYQHLVSLGKDKDDAKIFSSRLLGRLLFIWFLRKKGVVSQEEKYFPRDIEDSTKYYNSVLKPLFFKTFNTPVYDRTTGDKETPYLNGGLFEPHDNDWQYEETSFPSSYFNDLYEHLDRYNFTTDESSPDYEQVAIDPEMLGRVFESLLAEQRTDTGEQARKAKGAFYTPREIVSYMCKESLRQYLYTQLGDEKYHAGVDKLLDSPDYEWETAHSNAKRDLWTFEDMNKIVPRVIGMLDSLTVLDPACGSGAFPMGMLQLLTKTYERLDSRFDPYKTKLNIIQNNIFGVDIEPMAVEISRLRAWLAIIVDDDGNIDPLPNLDFKFVCADSLVPLEKSRSLWSDPGLQEKMANVREKFFNARKPEMKEKWKKEYYKLATPQADIFGDKRDSQLKSFDPFKNQRPATFFDAEYMFGVEKFDAVIGNPPYVHLEKMKDIAKAKYQPLNFKTYEARGDLYGLFFERGIKMLKENGVLTFITSNKWMRAGYGESLRNYFVQNTQPILLIDLGGGVFESATVDTDILVLNKSAYARPTLAVSANKELTSSNLEQYVKDHAEKMKFEYGESWVILSAIERSIKEKIERFGTPLKDWDIKISRGILTGLNEAFIIGENKRKEILDNCETADERERTDKIIRPILRGRDIRQNTYDWPRLYVIAMHNGYKDRDGHVVPRVDINRLPSLKRWFDDGDWNDKPEKGSNIHRLSIRTDKGDTPYNLRDCAYMDDFSQQKIIYPETTQSARFFCDSSGFMAEKTCFIMTGKNLRYISSTLSSKIFEFSYRRLFSSVELGERGYQYNKHALEKLPVATTNLDEDLTEAKIKEIYHLTDEEMNFASSSLNSSIE